MPSVEELLNSDEQDEQIETYAEENEELVIDTETRTINIPASETLFGVKGDKNIERKYFRCPKVVGDNVDLSKHLIYIAYVYTESNSGSIFPTVGIQPYHCDDVAVDGDDITFSWKLSDNVFQSAGFIVFKMYAKEKEDSPYTVFNTTPAIGTVLYTIGDGVESVVSEHPDIINQLIAKMESVQEIATPEAMQGYVNAYLEENPVFVSVDETLTKEGEAADAKVTGEEINSKAKKSGWNPEKIIGTDAVGNMIDMDVSQIDIKNLVFKSEDGKKYSVSVDNDGNVDVERQYEVSTDGLVLNLEVVNGIVTDKVSGEQYPSIDVLDNLFKCSNSNFPSFPIQMTDGTGYTIEIGYYIPDDQKGYLYGILAFGARTFLKIDRIRNDEEETYTKSLSFYPGQYVQSSLTFIHNLKSRLSLKNGIWDKNRIVPVGFRNDGVSGKLNIFYETGINKTGLDLGTSYSITRFGGNYNTLAQYIRVYNRYITDDEYENNIKASLSKASIFQLLGTVANGYAGLGSPLAFYRNSDNELIMLDTEMGEGEHTVFVGDDSTTYTNTMLPEVTKDYETSVEGIDFLHIPEYIYTDEVYSITAFPYPHTGDNLGDDFLMEYSVDETDICDCVNGIIIPKKEGSVTIHATMINTDFSVNGTMQIKERPVHKNKCIIPENYSDGVNSLIGTPIQTLKAMISAIDKAVSEGYDYICFSKGVYHIVPIKKEVNYTFPSDVTVDFGGSELFIDDNEFMISDAGGYTLFSLNGCHNTQLMNLTVYGERYNNTENAENYYSANVLFIDITKCDHCKIENIVEYSPCGMNIIHTSNAYNYNFGTDRKGKFFADDFSFGKLNDIGVMEESNDHICTQDYINVGLNSEEYPFYKIGMMGTRYYSTISSRWIEVYWFNANKDFLEKQRCFQFDCYKIPENGVYVKLCYPGTTLPTGAYGERQTVLDMFPFEEAYFTTIKDVKIFNPHAGAIIYTGGYACIIDKCYSDNSVLTGMRWAVDYEDGVMNQRHNIIKNSIIYGLVVMVYGYCNAYFNNYISTLKINNDGCACKIINNIINNVNIHNKENCLYIGNVYQKQTLNENNGGNYYMSENTPKTNWIY